MAPTTARDRTFTPDGTNFCGLPLIYEVSSCIFAGVIEKKGTLKNLIYSDPRLNKAIVKKATYALVLKTLTYKKIIDILFEKTNFLQNHSFDYSLASVLAYDFLFGAPRRAQSKTLIYFQANKETLVKALENLKSSPEGESLFSSVVAVRKGDFRMAPLKALLLYSFLMMTLPVASFFAARSFIETFFDVLSSSSNIYATVVSVVAVHVVLGLFVYEAYHEKPEKLEYAGPSKVD